MRYCSELLVPLFILVSGQELKKGVNDRVKSFSTILEFKEQLVHDISVKMTAWENFDSSQK